MSGASDNALMMDSVERGGAAHTRGLAALDIRHNPGILEDAAVTAFRTASQLAGLHRRCQERGDKAMSFIDYRAREISCKLVYHGPGLGGKTTNLQYIYSRTAPELRTQMTSVMTGSERTLSFSLAPQSLGEIRGFKIRLHLHTVPGAVFHDASRVQILKGVDGVVFVADSQTEREEANVESLERLETNLALQGYAFDRVPLVFQYNKRDLPNAAPVEVLAGQLNASGRPAFEAVAMTGVGVFDTLKSVAELVLMDLRRGSSSDGSESGEYAEA